MMIYQCPDNLTQAMMSGRTVSIVIIGAGGTGSALLTKLSQMNFLLKQLGGANLNVTLIDDDVVSFANVGRQSFYEFDVGRNKAECLIERFVNYNGVNWKAIAARVDDENLAEIIEGADVLFTCVDNPMTRVNIGKQLSAALELYADEMQLVWIDGGNDASHAQVVMGTYEYQHGQIARLPSIYDLHGTELETMEHIESDSCSHEQAIAKQDFGINDAVAHQMSQLLWKLLRYGSIEHHGVQIDLTSASVTPLPVCPDTWSIYGFGNSCPSLAS